MMLNSSFNYMVTKFFCITDHCTQRSAAFGDGNADVIYLPYTFSDFNLGEEKRLGFVWVSLIFTCSEDGRVGCFCLFSGYLIKVEPVWWILFRLFH